jgi:hypothetical protein
LIVFVCVVASCESENSSAARLPVDGAVDVDPNAALALLTANFDEYANPRAPDWGMRIAITAGDTGIEFFVAGSANYLFICPNGGLEPSTAYAWDVDREPETDSSNVARGFAFPLDGEWSFVTSTQAGTSAIVDEGDCYSCLANPASCGLDISVVGF